MGHKVLAADITTEAVVFRGCTTSEISAMGMLSLMLWGPVLIIGSISLFGSFFGGIGLLMMFTLMTVFIGTHILTRMKRDKPDGHYQLRIEFFLGQKQLKKTYFFAHTGELSIGRTRQIVFVRSHLDD